MKATKNEQRQKAGKSAHARDDSEDPKLVGKLQQIRSLVGTAGIATRYLHETQHDSLPCDMPTTHELSIDRTLRQAIFQLNEFKSEYANYAVLLERVHHFRDHELRADVLEAVETLLYLEERTRQDNLPIPF